MGEWTNKDVKEYFPRKTVGGLGSKKRMKYRITHASRDL
jgi:hypothetical protein